MAYCVTFIAHCRRAGTIDVEVDVEVLRAQVYASMPASYIKTTY